MTKNDKLLELVLEYQKTKSVVILSKIIELNKNLINWYLKNTDIDISKEDLCNLIINGLEYSVSMYDSNKHNNIISYISLGIRNTIYKNKIYIEENRNRLFTSFLDYKRVIEQKYGVTLEKDFSIFDDIIDLMIEKSIIRKSNKEKIKLVLKKLLIDYYGSIKLINNQTNNETVYSDYLERILKESLTLQEYNYLVLYFGLFGNNSYSLCELSKKDNVSRENICQIKNRALNKLKIIFEFYDKNNFKLDINKIRLLLLEILTKEEYFCLTSYYGLFNNPKKSYQQLEKICHMTAKNINSIIDQAISKIFFYIEYQDIKFPYNSLELDNILKKYLNYNEYKVFISLNGLYGIKNETKEEYASLNKISKDRVDYLLKNANLKIRNIIRKNNKILNFIQEILTEEELKFLSLRYGIYDGVLLTIKDIAKEYNQSVELVRRTINLALEKIIIKLKFINIEIDKNIILEVLQKLLTKEEYDYLCQTYGILGYQKLDKTSIDENTMKISRTNIKSLGRIATLLNIESKRI